jgi:arabinofuranosyltransferase
MNKSTGSNTNLITAVAILLLFIICSKLTYDLRFYTLDDALIYYRYIQNALDGKGLVYNVGERFNGLTSPFYTYLSLGTAYLFGNIPLTQIIQSGLFLFLSGFILILILRKLNFPVWLSFIPSFLIIPTRYFYLTFGLETTLFLFFTIFSIYLYIEKKYFLLGIISSLMFLTRGESLFLIISLIIFHFIEKRQFPNWKIFILPILILIANYSFNFYYYGEILPHTLSAKILQGGSGLWRTWPFFRVSYILFGPNWNCFPVLPQIFIAILVLIGFYGLITNFKKYRFLQILSLYLVLYTLFYSILQIPSYPWYYAIYYFSAFIFFGFGIKSIYDKLGSKNNFIPRIIVLSVFTLFFLSLLFVTLNSLKKETGSKSYKQAGLWIKNNTKPEAKIACVEIGHIGWYSDRYIIDILGLVNPHNAEFIGRKEFSRWLTVYTPDYIFVHYPLWDHEQGMKKYMKDSIWIPVKEFNVQNYLLLKKNPDK